MMLHERGSLLILMTVIPLVLLPVVLTSDEPSTGIIILPKALKPKHYEVWLQPFINGNFSVHGRVGAEFEVLVPTNHIMLHMTDIITTNESSKVTEKESGREISILQQQYEPTRNLYIATLQEKLDAGKSFVLSLEFIGTLGEQARGFYRSSYKKENGQISWVASTQFQSTDARRAFPCFDEPNLKATFKIYLGRETHMKALSNMPLVKSTPIENQPGWVWDEFEKSVPMSTYLVAFAISDFIPITLREEWNGTLLRVWVRDEKKSHIEYGGRVAMKGLQFFEDFFSINFPLPKLDMICPPEMSSNAMENWGLITYRESGFIYNPEKSSAETKKWVCYLMSHELAHQWFGNLVTMEWWTDLWLNEGFATFMGDKAVDYIEPSWGIMDQFVVDRQQIVMGLDALESSHPVSVPVNDPVEINEIFDIISYLKGASIIRMMSTFLTEDTFRKGLKNYLSELKYKNADQDDLWRFLTAAAHEDGTLSDYHDVKTIMDTWTLQKGFPVITVTRAGNNSAILTQQQFLYNKKSSEENSNKWYVPVTYTTQENPSFEDTQVKFWLNVQGIDPVSYIGFPELHHWVILNVKQSGYYRVNYDTDNWRLLIQQLQENHEVIHITNRAQIIDDALSMARAGRLSYDVALEVTLYLSKEKNYVPWIAAFNNFEYLYNMLRHDPVYGAFKEYLLSIISPLFDRIGFEEQEDEDLQTQLLRGIVLRWACQLRHQACLRKAVDHYRNWMHNSKDFKGISSNVAEAVYCTAVREGDEAEWKFAWEKKLQKALACTEKFWIIVRYLNGAFNESTGIRRQDASLVFRQIAEGSVGGILAWDFMKSNWRQITDYIGTTFFALPKMMQAVTKTFNKEQQLRELEKFQEDNSGNLLTATRTVTQAIEGTKLNIAWIKDSYEEIVQWLKDRGFSSELQPY